MDASGNVLWSICEADNNTKELLLGPGGYSAYKIDGLYRFGLSDPGMVLDGALHFASYELKILRVVY